MHEVQGLFCKSVIPWIISKFAAQKKTSHGPNLSGPIGEKNRGALGGLLTHGLGPVGVGGLAGRLGGEAGMQGHAGPKSRSAQARRGRGRGAVNGEEGRPDRGDVGRGGGEGPSPARAGAGRPGGGRRWSDPVVLDRIR